MVSLSITGVQKQYDMFVKPTAAQYHVEILFFFPERSVSVEISVFLMVEQLPMSEIIHMQIHTVVH